MQEEGAKPRGLEMQTVRISLKMGVPDRGKRLSGLSCRCLLQPKPPWVSGVLGFPTTLPPSNYAHWS